jgi:hypothetical protein
LVQGDRPGGLPAAERAARPRGLGHLFACAYHEGWLRTQHPQPTMRLCSTPWSASRCPTLLPHTVPRPSARRLHPAPSYPLPPPPAPAPLRGIHPHHLRLSLYLTCTSRASSVYLTCTSPAPHAPHAPHSCPSPGCVRQTADYPSTPVRGRDAIDSCDQQVVVMRGRSELEAVADIVCGGGSSR